MRISDWSSDVCSSDLGRAQHRDHGECAGRGGKRTAAAGADGAGAGARGAARGGGGGRLTGCALVTKAEPHHRKGWLERIDPRYWSAAFARPRRARGPSDAPGALGPEGAFNRTTGLWGSD